jgi:hypothetical protein
LLKLLSDTVSNLFFRGTIWQLVAWLLRTHLSKINIWII